MKKVEITCAGAGIVYLDDLVDFQGNLKDLSKENYEKLKKEILDLGFSEPISVWAKDGKMYCLNGHQRRRTLMQMRVEGYEIPPIPVNFIEAKDKKEAKKKVLALTSQYGEMTGQGLYEFSIDAGLNAGEIEEAFRFPEVDFDSWKIEFFGEGFEPGTEAEQGKLDEKKPIVTQCPNCGECFDANENKPKN